MFLVTEEVLRNVVGTELIECNKIIDPDHRGHLADIDLLENFTE